MTECIDARQSHSAEHLIVLNTCIVLQVPSVYLALEAVCYPVICLEKTQVHHAFFRLSIKASN